MFNIKVKVFYILIISNNYRKLYFEYNVEKGIT